MQRATFPCCSSTIHSTPAFGYKTTNFPRGTRPGSKWLSFDDGYYHDALFPATVSIFHPRCDAARKTHACRPVRVHARVVHFVCTICIRLVCNDLRTSTRVRFINAFRVGLDRQCNEKFLNDVKSNATLLAFVCLFIPYYVNCIFKLNCELYDMCIVLWILLWNANFMTY